MLAWAIKMAHWFCTMDFHCVCFPFFYSYFLSLLRFISTLSTKNRQKNPKRNKIQFAIKEYIACILYIRYLCMPNADIGKFNGKSSTGENLTDWRTVYMCKCANVSVLPVSYSCGNFRIGRDQFLFSFLLFFSFFLRFYHSMLFLQLKNSKLWGRRIHAHKYMCMLYVSGDHFVQLNFTMKNNNNIMIHNLIGDIENDVVSSSLF